MMEEFKSSDCRPGTCVELRESETVCEVIEVTNSGNVKLRFPDDSTGLFYPYDIARVVSQPTTTLSEEQLGEWEHDAASATPGPWAEPYREEDEGYVSWWTHNGREGAEEFAIASTFPSNRNGEADARFVTHARTAVPALIAEVRRLRVENEELKQTRVADAEIVKAAEAWSELAGYGEPSSLKEEYARMEILNQVHAKRERSSLPPVIEQQELDEKATARKYAVDAVFHMISARCAPQWRRQEQDELKRELLNRLERADAGIRREPASVQQEQGEETEIENPFRCQQCGDRIVVNMDPAWELGQAIFIPIRCNACLSLPPIEEPEQNENIVVGVDVEADEHENPGIVHQLFKDRGTASVDFGSDEGPEIWALNRLKPVSEPSKEEEPEDDGHALSALCLVDGCQNHGIESSKPSNPDQTENVLTAADVRRFATRTTARELRTPDALSGYVP